MRVQIVAIIAFLLLLGTFAVGVRCFRDFDRGLKTSKVHCQFLSLALSFDAESRINKPFHTDLGSTATNHQMYREI